MWATRRPQHAETLFNMLKLDVFFAFSVQVETVFQNQNHLLE